MLAVIIIEGVKVNAKAIPKKQLALIWKTLSSKAFPRVKAFQLDDGDFDRVMALRKCWADVGREMIEWGRVLSTKGTDACVFNADEFVEVDYVILVRENPYHSLKEVLEHELSHIARGDL
jgi:hypothetical protein